VILRHISCAVFHDTGLWIGLLPEELERGQGDTFQKLVIRKPEEMHGIHDGHEAQDELVEIGDAVRLTRGRKAQPMRAGRDRPEIHRIAPGEVVPGPLILRCELGARPILIIEGDLNGGAVQGGSARQPNCTKALVSEAAERSPGFPTLAVSNASASRSYLQPLSVWARGVVRGGSAGVSDGGAATASSAMQKRMARK
jgi:hypothetical protein